MNETSQDPTRNTKLLNWKITDVVAQIGTIVLPYLWLVFLSGNKEDRELIMFKSMVAANVGWVMLSLIVHIWVWRTPWIVLGRKILAVIYLSILVSELLYMVFVAPHIISGRSGPPIHAIVMLGLMACVPLMGIPYFLISILELNRLKAGIRTGRFPASRQH